MDFLYFLMINKEIIRINEEVENTDILPTSSLKVKSFQNIQGYGTLYE